MNIVGSIFNKLFGTLDDDYAQEMKTTIGRIQSNENHLNKLFRNQTSILDSTVNLIKRDRAEILNHTLSVKKAIDDGLSNLTNQVTREFRESRALEYFNLLSTLVISYLREYEYIQDNFADIIFGLQQGHTSSHIMSPEQFQSQLDTIRQQLPSSLSVVQVNQFELQTLYKVMTTQGRVSGNYFLFKVQIPLVTNNQFKLYHLVPVPVIVNNTQMMIEQTTEYLAIDLRNNEFYALTANELEGCALLTTELHICHQVRPIEYEYIKAHKCESELMAAKSLPSSCSITYSYPRNTFTQLSTRGSWLFSVTRSIDASVICQNGVTKRITISDAGIISLEKGCTLRTKDTTLTSFQDIITKLQLADQPHFNLTDSAAHLRLEGLKNNSTKISPTLFTHQTLNILEGRINDLKIQQDQLQELQPHDIHQFSVSYTTLGLVIIIICILVHRAFLHFKSVNLVTKEADKFTLKSVQLERPEDV